eukprot:3474488-Amphidinium_carterae.1
MSVVRRCGGGRHLGAVPVCADNAGGGFAGAHPLRWYRVASGGIPRLCGWPLIICGIWWFQYSIGRRTCGLGPLLCQLADALRFRCPGSLSRGGPFGLGHVLHQYLVDGQVAFRRLSAVWCV